MASAAAYDPVVDDPAWWTDPATGIYEGGAAPTSGYDHQSPVTIGQLKYVAAQAQAVLDQELAPIGGAGADIDTLLSSFSTGEPENYAPVNVGQLKAVSANFFDRFEAIGFDPADAGWPTSLVLMDTSPGVTDNSPNYPWLDDQTPENYSPANIGQLKHLFSWDITTFAAGDLSQIDTDGDGLPDWWELQIIDADPNDGITGFADVLPGDDFDEDRISNIVEYLQSLNPTSAASNDGDTIPDDWELFYLQTLDYTENDTIADGGLTLAEAFEAGTDPNVTDTDGDGISDRYEKDNQLDLKDAGDRYKDMDADGLNNWMEFFSGTSADLIDSDNDGENDGEDGWAMDNNLQYPRVSESYVLIDLSDELQYPATGGGSLSIDNHGGVLCSTTSEALYHWDGPPSVSAVYYLDGTPYEPPYFNKDIGTAWNVQPEDLFSFHRLGVSLSKEGLIYFDFESWADRYRDPQEFVSGLEQAINIAAGQSTPFQFYDFSWLASYESYMTLLRGRMVGDSTVVTLSNSSGCPGTNESIHRSGDPSEHYIEYIVNVDGEVHLEKEVPIAEAGGYLGGCGGSLYFDFRISGGLNGTRILKHHQYIEPNESIQFQDIGAVAFNEAGLAGELPAILSVGAVDVFARGTEYSLDGAANWHPLKVAVEGELSDAAFRTASDDLVMLGSATELYINQRKVSVEELVRNAEGYSNFRLRDINAHGQIVASATYTDPNTQQAEERAVMLLKMDLEWQTLDGKTADEDSEDQLEKFIVPDDYAEYTSQDLSWLEGQRYFPDSESQDTEAFRNKVNVKVSVPGYKNGEVKLRAFDVDDPTPIADVDDNDTSGPAGDDNQDTVEVSGVEIDLGIFSGEVSTGTKVSENSAEKSITVTLDDNGEAVVEFVLGVQPGNNYRIAAELQIDGQTSEIGNLQVATQGGTYVSGDNEPVAGLSMGTVSDMLTVWRKLHIEIDSMESGPPASGDESNTVSGTITAYAPDTPTTGRSTLTLDRRLPDEEDRFKAGNITLSGAGVFEVKSNSDNLINDDTVEITGTPGNSVIGQAFTIVDDDDFYLAEVGLSDPLPQDGSNATYINAIRPKYAPAYIEVEDANALGFNPNKRIAFKLNEKTIGIGNVSHFDNAKDLNDTQFFWAHTLVFGYQAQAEINLLGDGGDGDPNGEPPMLGGTPKTGISKNQSEGYSVIFMEAVRDQEISSPIPENILNNQQSMDGYNDRFVGTLLGTVAHEIAHSPGEQSAGSDHAEEGLMREGGARIDVDFSGASIKRFRKALGWSE